MAKRQDHMLEALRASVGQDPTPSQAPSIGSRAGTPAPGASAVRPAPTPTARPAGSGALPAGPQDTLTGSWVRPSKAPATAASPRRLPLGTAAFIGLQMVLLAAAFGVGWLAAGGEVPGRRAPAAGSASVEPTPLAQATFELLPTAPRPSAAPSRAGSSRGAGAAAQAPAPRQAPSAATSAADRALRDPANRYTVQVVQYPSTSPKHRGYAEDTFQRLVEAGLPACTPLEVEGALFLVVGAAPTTAALADLRKRLASLPDPRTGRPMFNSPYEIRIDSLLRR
ncbi:MAG: hypothetical protein ISQ08_10230 [Planctomycetes bacterium]|nr:hypothetical protein [Planctomycetota bacterium]